MANVKGDTTEAGVAGVLGQSTNESNTAGPGVHGISQAAGVIGDSKKWHGVAGLSQSTIGGAGVYGKNNAGGPGVIGESDAWMAVYGKSASTNGGAGVMGEAVGPGVIGKSQTWMGVYGETQSTTGGAGVWGEHKNGGTGVVGVSDKDNGVGVHGKGKRLAGFFEGDVEVTGDIRLRNADCAEEFDACELYELEPGTVVVLGEKGVLHESQQAYDTRVAGVVSGAGAYKPGIVLDRQPLQSGRKPLALLGKVYCKADASYAAIEVGDLLTTAPTAGHAMKALDPLKAFGAVIGKALRPLRAGRGLIPILVALR